MPKKSAPARRRRDSLESAIENALEPGHFIEYRAAWPFVERLEEVEEELENLVHSDPLRAAALYETFIAGCYEKAEEIDDSSGGFGMFVDELFCGWIKARQAGGADPDETAERLRAWMDEDPYGFCLHLEGEVAKLLDKKGLAVFIAQAQARLAEVTALAADAADERARSRLDYRRRRWTEILKKLYAARRDIAAYKMLCEATELNPADCEVLAELLQSRRKLQEALAWVERGLELEGKKGWNRQAYKLPEMKRKLLEKLGRSSESLASAWADFQACPDPSSYKELMRYAPETGRAAWHEKAMAALSGAPLDLAIDLLLETEETDRLVARLRNATNEELEALSHYTTEPAAKRLAKSHPDVAAKLYCAMGMRILEASKSKYYAAAHSHFKAARQCYGAAGLENEWLSVVEEVRKGHSRKYSFMSGFEEIVAGKVRKPEPSFLDRAKQRWSKS